MTPDDPSRPRRRLRLAPGRRDDLRGFNAFWWVLLGLIVIVLAVYPLPGWL